MTTATTSTPATAPPLTRPPRPPGLRLQLAPSLVGTGAVDGGWWPRSRDPDAELAGLLAGLDTSLVVLLVIPPEATTTAAQIAMATAADAANSAEPVDILAAAGIGGQDPAPGAAQ